MGFKDWERLTQELSSTLVNAIIVRPGAVRAAARLWRRRRQKAGRGGVLAGAGKAARAAGDRCGSLVLVGEGRPGDEVVVRLIKCAGGRQARIVAVSCGGAGDVPEAFLRFGASGVESISPAGPAPLPGGVEAWRAALRGAGLVFVDGADRGALRGLLLDGLWRAVRDCHEAMVPVAARGAAAGLLVGLLGTGDDVAEPDAGALRVFTDMTGLAGPGDPDPDAAGAADSGRRFNVQLHLLARALRRGILAIGVTAGAAAVFGPSDEFRVAGDGAVLVVEAQGPARANRPAVRRGAMPALLDLRVQVLPADWGFDLATRRPIPPPPRPQARVTEA